MILVLEDKLSWKQSDALRKLRGLRKPKTEDVFKRLIYLGPEDFKIIGYKKSKPTVAFNPAALLEGNEILLLPRLIFDYYKYVSSVGLARLNIDDVLQGYCKTPISARIILWPTKLWEFLGSEDPRVYKINNKYYILYTGKGYYFEHRNYIRRDVLALAQYDNSWRLERKDYFSIIDNNEEFVPKSNKDSAFINMKNGESVLLTRPEIKGERICWKGQVRIEDLKIYEKTLEPVMVYEKWEWKVGWSTNTVKLSNNEYLIGWHGVCIEDNSYRDGLAIVNDEGELLAVSNYLLSPKELNEEYGDRPLVIFGDGLIKYKEFLLWIGGISDYAIGIFAAELNKILEKMTWLR